MKELNARQIKIFELIRDDLVYRDTKFTYRYSMNHECDRTVYALEARGLIALERDGTITITKAGEVEWIRLQRVHHGVDTPVSEEATCSS